MSLDMTRQVRWEHAAARALANDLPHRLRQQGGAVVVPSKTAAGVSYRVQVAGNRAGVCDCPAGLLGKPCAHRASVAIRLYERETGTRVVALKAGGVAAMERYLRDA